MMQHSPAVIPLNTSTPAPLSTKPAWARGLVFQTTLATGGEVYFGAGNVSLASYGFHIPGGGDVFTPPINPSAFLALHQLFAILDTGSGGLTWFAAEYTENLPV
jgi:hypothetical protein